MRLLIYLSTTIVGFVFLMDAALATENQIPHKSAPSRFEDCEARLSESFSNDLSYDVASRANALVALSAPDEESLIAAYEHVQQLNLRGVLIRSPNLLNLDRLKRGLIGPGAAPYDPTLTISLVGPAKVLTVLGEDPTLRGLEIHLAVRTKADHPSAVSQRVESLWKTFREIRQAHPTFTDDSTTYFRLEVEHPAVAHLNPRLFEHNFARQRYYLSRAGKTAQSKFTEELKSWLANICGDSPCEILQQEIGPYIHIKAPWIIVQTLVDNANIGNLPVNILSVAWAEREFTTTN